MTLISNTLHWKHGYMCMVFELVINNKPIEMHEQLILKWQCQSI